MVRAIFFDVDGTLVSFQTHRVPEPVLQALHHLRQKGIKLFLSTGRHSQMLGYITSVFDFDGLVTLSGQYCLCDGKVLRRNPMPQSHVDAVVKAAEKHGFSCIVLAGDEMYMNHCDQLAHEFLVGLDIPVLPFKPLSHALEQEVYQMIAFLSPEQEHILPEENPDLTFTRWNPTFLDIIPPTGGKDLGLQAVMEHCGFRREEVMAFGDGENDLSMLRFAGIGVAMGSASDFVRSQADYATGTVEELGILTALEHYGIL